MSFLIAVATALAGGLGAAARVSLDSVVTARLRSPWPWGTAVVNVLGCAAMGVALGLAGHDSTWGWYAVATTGFLGGFTTFSTASVESVMLSRRRHWGAGVLHAAFMLAACAAALALGMVATTI